MKRLVLGIFALLLTVSFVAPAFAADMSYGGYWRTRAYSMGGFTGADGDESMDYSLVDARGRLWVSYQINDDLVWYNRVEFNTTWGDAGTGGDIGTDGTDQLRIKNSWVSYNMDPVTMKIGLQSVTVADGFLFSDDFAGLVLAYNGDNFSFPFVWIKAFEGTGSASGTEDPDEFDVDMVGVNPVFTFDEFQVNPFFFYLFAEDASNWSKTTGNTDMSVYFLGLSLAYNGEDFGGSLLGIYEGGSADTVYGGEFDIRAYLLGAKLYANFDAFEIHAEAFMASGDDDATDDDIDAFAVPQGQSYYWSEIMGMGVFDKSAPNGGTGDQITNIAAFNIGASYQVTDAVKLSADIWHANLMEDNAAGDDELGTEIDLRADWGIDDDLMLTAVGGYLFAGDVVAPGDDDENPWEVGVRLSFRFSGD